MVGSAGSDEKVRYVLDELGFDAAFNYRSARFATSCARRRPTVSTSTSTTSAVTTSRRPSGACVTFGRAALCGAISQYNTTKPPPGPRNLGLAVPAALTLRGFIILDHLGRFADFMAEVGPWLADGSIRTRETIVDGIENAPAAFIGLLSGDNVGKMLVRTNLTLKAGGTPRASISPVRWWGLRRRGGGGSRAASRSGSKPTRGARRPRSSRSSRFNARA